MSDHPHDYMLSGKTIAVITYPDILQHSSEIIDSDQKGYFDMQPSVMELNFGLFTHPSSLIAFPLVSVTQTEDAIILSCPCSATKRKLCVHQSQVLHNILTQPYLRIFFDTAFRQVKLQEAARDYGMEQEDNLDDFFQVVYTGKAVEIQPKMPELMPVNPQQQAHLQEQLLPRKSGIPQALQGNQDGKKMIVVLRRHKYYDQLQIELCTGEMTLDGKIKNPVSSVDPLELIWKAQRLEEARFFTGIARFQNNHVDEHSASDVAALQMLVQNPLGLEMFYHDKRISDNITASSIVPVAVKALESGIQLSVFKKEPFFEVSGELVIQGKAYPFKSLTIKYGYFIAIGNTLRLIADEDMLRIIRFFKSNNDTVLIHASKYEEFRQNILAPLEHQISIHYSYIKAATQKQLVERHFDQAKEKIIYLSDHDNYVLINPVMKYGQVEVPVFSRKQVLDTDANGNVFKVTRDTEAEIAFTAFLVRQHPDFEEQLHQGVYFYLHKSKFLEEHWFLDAFEAWKNQNILVYGFNTLKQNKLNAHKAKVSVTISSGIDWFNAALSVRFGQQKASLKQLYKAIRNRSKFVQLDDGTSGILPDEWMEKFAAYFQSGEAAEAGIRIPKTNFKEIDRLFHDALMDPEVKQELQDIKARFASFQGIQEVAVPTALNATLRDYQVQGLKWLNFLDDFNFGACLADDMGLGKTVQILAFILLQRQKQPHNTNLVVVPTSLLFNWQAEVQKFAPSIRIFTHYGSSKLGNKREFDSYEIILTTYGTLLTDIRLLKDYHFNYVFLDESQAIKNPESQRYKAARLLQSRNKVVLTGTPVENNTFDIYGQLSFACPGLLGSRQQFKELYAIPIDRFDFGDRAVELQQKIAPFILRRTKKEVAKELPEKTEMVIYCEMGEEQRKVYNVYEAELRDYISGKNDDDMAKSSMHVLTGLTKLRQICNSPTLIRDEEHLGDFSSKIDTLLEQIENKSPQHKILVFSQFVSMLDLIKKELEKRHIPFEYLTGKTRNRASAVNEFQENSQVRVFLISLKAGGTGLNLTEADYVYLVDPWWNPAVENQAIDRCYRIGQKKKVIAVRLICPDTIEEKIMKLQASKTKLVSDLIRTDDAVFKSFSKTDLLAMLQ